MIGNDNVLFNTFSIFKITKLQSFIKPDIEYNIESVIMRCHETIAVGKLTKNRSVLL